MIKDSPLHIDKRVKLESIIVGMGQRNAKLQLPSRYKSRIMAAVATLIRRMLETTKST